MVAIDNEDNNTIYITRGDRTNGKFNKLAFYFPIYNFTTKKEENYIFQLDDKIEFIVMDKKGYTKPEIFRKTYTIKELGYTEPTEYPEIPLTAEDTKNFPLLNKRKTYWYDIVLNDDTTILGYDSDGAKKIVVYPEGGE
ncbi:hypothetical protein [uncultured Thomasclavelia sp.]|uniref:hypothetical protein n=1 Tax=uncultured Thomasclavelia sp. TaxID=3025759 RepID=UPI002595B6C2|nr:hypothetical protein [uncultured Thomasclavelia sp.]